MRQTHLHSWKWKMKIRLMCFNSRREAGFNQPHMPQPSSSTSPACHATQQLALCDALSCAERIPCRRFNFSATHNCCIIVSSCPCYFSARVHKLHPDHLQFWFWSFIP
ncbi:hypothetical protein OJAV_G00077810 [Oryzias javanicus]|uniref:Uncharacterized protein n=1 Tax=Oryzias javanicus TaxID=123683 RepID=A0A3S2MYG9_ORYJA|nr:hypothetical protein OJAV_G00077810 [Oryzias javanicus]